MGVIGSRAVRRITWIRGWIVAAVIAAAFLPILFLGAATDPDILWKIVHGKCVVDEKTFGHPAPCARVDLAGGYAILKDIVGQTQYLLIPTSRVSGIESPAVLEPATPNFFAEAWAQTPLVAARLGHALPRQDLSLAINSIHGRTQDQLHIHIDCIDPKVAAALKDHLGAVGTSWSPFPGMLAGDAYEAMRIDGETLQANPFRLLADQLEGARNHMGAYTLVLVGANFQTETPGASTPGASAPGFILLAGRARLSEGNVGSGEALQDHACRIGRAA